MKKALTIVVAAAMLFSSALTGCGGKAPEKAAPEKTAASTDKPSQEKKAEPSALPEVKLTLYFGGDWPQADQDMVFGKANEYIKGKINATVNFKPMAFGDYDQKMKVIIAAGEDYDICFSAPWINNYAQNVSKGAFLPLDDLLPKYAPKRWEALKNYWDATRIQGKIYGFINEQIFARTACVAVDKDMAEKYKFDETYKQGDLNSLTPFVDAVFKADPKRYTAISFNDIPEVFNMEYVGGASVPAGVLLDDSNMKAFNYFEHPNFMNYVNLMRDWNKKGYLHAEEQLAKKRDDTSTKGQRVSILEVGGAYKPGIDADLSASAGFERIGRPAGTPTLTTSGVIATMFAVNRNSKNPERSVMFLELLNTDAKLYNLVNFGVEGTHYTLENGFMVKSQGDANHKKYYPGVPWELGTNFLAIPAKGASATVWEDTKKLNDTARKSVLFGFTFNADPVKSEIGKCSAVIEEYSKSISLGLLDDAKYKAFLTKLKAAGADAVVAEAQKQIDAWKAAKK